MQELPGVNSQRLNGDLGNRNEAGGLQFKEEPSRVTMSRMKSSYGEELKKQMQADKRKRRKSREQDQDDDIHFLRESYNYQPFGKGGGGAPLRDQFGNMITSRKPQMRGDHDRQHFKGYIRNSSRGSSRASRRSRFRQGEKSERYQDFNDTDEFNEPDTIATGPINNTTAATAAQMASNTHFKPDYVVSYDK